MASNQQLFDMENKIKALEKKIDALVEANENLANKLIYKDKELNDTLYNLTNDNFSALSFSADQYIRVGTGVYKAGIEGANSPTDIVYWAGTNLPSTDSPYYVLADGTLHATKAFIGAGGTDADDLATYDDADALAAAARSNAELYALRRTDGTYTMEGAKLKSTGGNLLINMDGYYLYAMKNVVGLGLRGFYVDTLGDALFTGNITSSELTSSNIYGSRFYGSGDNPAYVKVGTIGSNADLSVYKGIGTYPTFRVYDGSSYIALQAGTNSASSPSNFLEIYSSEIRPQGTWDFQDCTTQNLYAKYA